jgi:hypothetical protein
MAFLSTPGMARLYSGVTNSTPSEVSISRLSWVTAGGRRLPQVVVVVRQAADIDDVEAHVGRRETAERLCEIGVV